MFECDIAYRRPVAVLCILYKIRCNPLHPLSVVLPGLYVSVPVTGGALVAHRYTYELPHSQYRTTLQGQCHFIGLAACSALCPTVFPFYSFILTVGIVGLGSSDR